MQLGVDISTKNLVSKIYLLLISSAMKQSECQQLICEILRATPEAASADAAVQTARLASKAPSKDKRHVFSRSSLSFLGIFWNPFLPSFGYVFILHLHVTSGTLCFFINLQHILFCFFLLYCCFSVFRAFLLWSSGFIV